MYWLLCGGEKERIMHTGERVTFIYLPIQKSCVYSFRRRDLRGKRPNPPPAIFSFLFCLAPFSHNKIRTHNIAMYIHTLPSYTKKI